MDIVKVIIVIKKIIIIIKKLIDNKGNKYMATRHGFCDTHSIIAKDESEKVEGIELREINIRKCKYYLPKYWQKQQENRAYYVYGFNQIKCKKNNNNHINNNINNNKKKNNKYINRDSEGCKVNINSIANKYIDSDTQSILVERQKNKFNEHNVCK